MKKKIILSVLFFVALFISGSLLNKYTQLRSAETHGVRITIGDINNPETTVDRSGNVTHYEPPPIPAIPVWPQPEVSAQGVTTTWQLSPDATARVWGLSHAFWSIAEYNLVTIRDTAISFLLPSFLLIFMLSILGLLLLPVLKFSSPELIKKELSMLALWSVLILFTFLFYWIFVAMQDNPMNELPCPMLHKELYLAIVKDDGNKYVLDGNDAYCDSGFSIPHANTIYNTIISQKPK